MRALPVLVSVLALLLTSACKSAYPPMPKSGEGGQPFRWEFKPPVGQQINEKVTWEYRPGGTAVQRIELQMQSVFAPAGSLWKLTQRVTSAKFWVDDQEQPHPLGAVLTLFPLEMELSADGSFIRVLNPEAALAAVEKADLPASVKTVFGLYFSPATVEARARHEWETRYGALFGRNLPRQQRLYSVELLPGTEGPERAFLLERTLVGTRLTDFGESLVFHFRCPGQLPKDLPPSAVEKVQAWKGPALDPAVHCQGEQVVARDPSVPVRWELLLGVAPPGEASSVPSGSTWLRQSITQNLEPLP